MFDVGQILYLVALKTAKVVPARVTAVTITRTLDKEVVSHLLEFADAPGREASLEDLNVEIFKSTSELNDFMLRNAKNAVEREVEQALEKTAHWTVELKKSTSKSAKKSVSRGKRKKTPSLPTNNDTITVMLDDGVKANVTLPAELS
jgi:hypothetical protein